MSELGEGGDWSAGDRRSGAAQSGAARRRLCNLGAQMLFYYDGSG